MSTKLKNKFPNTCICLIVYIITGK